MGKRPGYMLDDGYMDLDIFLNLGLLVSALWFSKVTLESILSCVDNDNREDFGGHLVLAFVTLL